MVKFNMPMERFFSSGKDIFRAKRADFKYAQVFLLGLKEDWLLLGQSAIGLKVMAIIEAVR
jgi:hypothetical protein